MIFRRLNLLPALLGSALLQSAAQASTIAIVDSGTDLTHPELAPKAWINPQDDAAAGYPGDLHGWNFVDNNSTLVNLDQLDSFSPDVYAFFDIQARVMEGIATEEDKKWINDHKKDKAFYKQLDRFGDFAHGTNVAGIASKDASQVKLMVLKMIGAPAPVKKPSQFNLFAGFANPEFVFGFQDRLIKRLIDELFGGSAAAAGADRNVGQYLTMKAPRVANCSFGNNLESVRTLIKGMILVSGGIFYSEKDLERYYNYAMKKMLNAQRQDMIEPASDTLFVIAAGNDSSDNDKYFAAPANIKTDNAIAVAATLGRKKLASFSNYGATNVDVAAPGVGILATSPGGKYVRMSGTSQATPYVSNAAGQILDANPRLVPTQTKQILIGTVDSKDYLKGKVASGGIVNPARAVRAAVLSIYLPLDAAIAQAKLQVADLPEDETLSDDADAYVDVTPLRGEYLLK